MRRNLLGVPEAADVLGITPLDVRRLVSKQAIPFVMVGPFVRFDRDVLDTWRTRLATIELRERQSPIDLRTTADRADSRRKV